MYITIRNTLCLFMLIAFHKKSMAQANMNGKRKQNTNFTFYSNSGFGLFVTSNNSKVLAGYGMNYNFQIQMNYKKQCFSRLQFDQYTLGYKTNLVSNGTNIQIGSKVNLSNVGIDFGNFINISKKITATPYAGIGFTVLTTPIAGYINSLNEIKFSSLTQSLLSWRYGASINYSYNRHLIIYTEIQYYSMPHKTNIENKPLNGYGIQLGFKTPLQ
jgi:hypothetical protein